MAIKTLSLTVQLLPIEEMLCRTLEYTLGEACEVVARGSRKERERTAHEHPVLVTSSERRLARDGMQRRVSGEQHPAQHRQQPAIVLVRAINQRGGG